MCTVGTVFDQESEQTLVFKQCDLPQRVRFHEPQVRRGSGGLRYALFTRGADRRPWAGFNSAGVCIMGADAYLDPDPDVNPPWEPPGDLSLDDVYPATMAHCESAEEAAEYLLSLYEEVQVPDMALVSDGSQALLVESSPAFGVHVRVADAAAGFLASTNHFLGLPGAVPMEDNPSTYLRLQRAEEILSESPDGDGVMELLQDQAHGETERSICRVAEEEGQYFTQASVVVAVGDDGALDCLYLLNGNPRTRAYTHWQGVFTRRARKQRP